MYKLVLICSLLVVGCSSPGKYAANEHGVTITGIYHYNSGEAMSMAEGHCAKYGKKYKVTIDSAHSTTFECL